MLEIQRAGNFLKIAAELIYSIHLSAAQKHRAFKDRRWLVGKDIVYLSAIYFEIADAFHKFGRRGEFLSPPLALLHSVVYIMAFASAKCEYSRAVDVKDLTTHQMKQISAYSVDSSALPNSLAAFVEKFKIFVGSV